MAEKKLSDRISRIIDAAEPAKDRPRLPDEYEAQLEELDRKSCKGFLTFEEVAAQASELAEELGDPEMAAELTALLEQQKQHQNPDANQGVPNVEIEDDDSVVTHINDLHRSSRRIRIDSEAGLEGSNGTASHAKRSG